MVIFHSYVNVYQRVLPFTSVAFWFELPSLFKLTSNKSTRGIGTYWDPRHDFFEVGLSIVQFRQTHKKPFGILFQATNIHSYGHLSVVSTNKTPFIECIIPLK